MHILEKLKKLKINPVSVHLKNLEREGQIKPNESRKHEIL